LTAGRDRLTIAHTPLKPRPPNPLPALALPTLSLALLGGLLGCSHTQSAATPTATAGMATSSTSSKTTKAASAWNNPSKMMAPTSAADLTAPVNAAMMLCSHMLNLTPCGLVTSSADEVVACFSGCQSQIEFVVELEVQEAANKCAASTPQEDQVRECALHFPEGAAVDAPALGKLCNERCEELVVRGARPGG
jgi:hypothetical protein